MESRIKERPILFTGAMVRAILDDQKTKTRRVIKPPKSWIGMYTQDAWANGEQLYYNGNRSIPVLAVRWITGRLQAVRCPYGRPGDRLWVRETWASTDTPQILYRADWYGKNTPPAWKPSIHMPRWASRILLEVVSVRVERLKDISDADCRAEGIEKHTKDGELWKYGYEGLPWADWWSTAIGAFGNLWAGINGFASWNANPWVWVVEFKRVEA